MRLYLFVLLLFSLSPAIAQSDGLFLDSIYQVRNLRKAEVTENEFTYAIKIPLSLFVRSTASVEYERNLFNRINGELGLGFTYNADIIQRTSYDPGFYSIAGKASPYLSANQQSYLENKMGAYFKAGTKVYFNEIFDGFFFNCFYRYSSHKVINNLTYHKIDPSTSDVYLTSESIKTKISNNHVVVGIGSSTYVDRVFFEWNFGVGMRSTLYRPLIVSYLNYDNAIKKEELSTFGNDISTEELVSIDLSTILMKRVTPFFSLGLTIGYLF